MNEDDTFRKLKKLPFDEVQGRYFEFGKIPIDEFGKIPIDKSDIEDFWESTGWTPEEYFSKIYELTTIHLTI